MLRTLLCLLLLAAVSPASGQNLFLMAEDVPHRDRYHTGGRIALDARSQAFLDQHANVIGLGLNTEWLMSSFIRPREYVDALQILVMGLEQKMLPGAVVYLDRAGGPVFPLPVGYLMTDPMLVYAQFGTIYDLGELTGVLTAVPLILKAIEHGEITMEQTVGEFIPELAESEKGSLTIGQLLNHKTGLPRDFTPGRPLGTMADALEELASMPLIKLGDNGGEFSRYNNMILGLVVEKLHARPAQEVAQEELLDAMEMLNSTFDLPVTWRQTTAPGPHTPWRGRLAWGETTDPIAAALGKSNLGTGMFSNADDLRLMTLSLTPAFGAPDSFLTTDTLKLIQGTAAEDDKPHQSLGFQVGRFGPGSFGFDAQEGPSIWIMPEDRAVLVFISNFQHPDVDPRRRMDIRRKLFPALYQALISKEELEALTLDAPMPEDTARQREGEEPSP